MERTGRTDTATAAGSLPPVPAADAIGGDEPEDAAVEARMRHDAVHHPDREVRNALRFALDGPGAVLEVGEENEGDAAVAALDDRVPEPAVIGPGFYRAPEVARALADALRAHRAAHGLSQRDAARVLGLYQSQVARLESGDKTPELETLIRVARELGLTLTVRITPHEATLEVEGDRTPGPAE